VKRRIWRGLAAATGGLILLGCIAGYATTAGCAAFGSAARGERLERMQSSHRYAGGIFTNEEPTKLMSAGETFKISREFFLGNDQMRVPSCTLPMESNVAARLATAPRTGLRITWLGHSTTLIEIDGRTVLTDPMWSDRASPSVLVGPRRFHPPPLPLQQLPRIDAVLISHDHYDHLDMRSVRALAVRGATFHVALGVAAHLEGWGVAPERLVEHDWWQRHRLGGGVEVVSTPSRHFSGRGLFDRNETLWTSWVIVGPQHRVYFSGDTGQTAAFQTIREKLGPFDVAMLEIGQYHPSWGQIHLGPVGALDALKALGARFLLPVHWATFELGLHAWSEPAETLHTEAGRRGVSLVTPRLGEPVEPTAGGAASPSTPWWRALPPLAAHCPPGTAR
jgi:L-ascorbate metabolism protein UlaG (beta-lactamase superfamily)